MKKHLVIGVLAAAGLFAGCQHKPAPPVEKLVPLPAETFRRQWRQPIPLENNDSVNRLFLRGDLVIVYTRANRAFHLERDSGLRIASVRPGTYAAPLRPPALVGDQIVYPISTTLEVYDRYGNKVNTITLDDNISSGGVADGKDLLIGVDHERGGRVLKIDTTTTAGKGIMWQLMTRARVSGTPAVLKGVVYIGSQDSKVYAAIVESRNSIWPDPGTFKTDDRIVADVIVDDQGVYVASMDTKLYCLSPLTSKTTWLYFAGVPLDTAPVVTATTVYQLVPGKGIVAIDKVNTDSNTFHRKPRWTASGAKQVLAEDDKLTYVAMQDNKIVALDRLTGEERFRSKRSDFTVFASNTTSATIFAANSGGEVYAITPVLKGGSIGQLVMDTRRLATFASAD